MQKARIPCIQANSNRSPRSLRTAANGREQERTAPKAGVRAVCGCSLLFGGWCLETVVVLGSTEAALGGYVEVLFQHCLLLVPRSSSRRKRPTGKPWTLEHLASQCATIVEAQQSEREQNV